MVFVDDPLELLSPLNQGLGNQRFSHQVVIVVHIQIGELLQSQLIVAVLIELAQQIIDQFQKIGNTGLGMAETQILIDGQGEEIGSSCLRPAGLVPHHVLPGPPIQRRVPDLVVLIDVRLRHAVLPKEEAVVLIPGDQSVGGSDVHAPELAGIVHDRLINVLYDPSVDVLAHLLNGQNAIVIAIGPEKVRKENVRNIIN